MLDSFIIEKYLLEYCNSLNFKCNIILRENIEALNFKNLQNIFLQSTPYQSTLLNKKIFPINELWMNDYNWNIVFEMHELKDLIDLNTKSSLFEIGFRGCCLGINIYTKNILDNNTILGFNCVSLHERKCILLKIEKQIFNIITKFQFYESIV